MSNLDDMHFMDQPLSTAQLDRYIQTGEEYRRMIAGKMRFLTPLQMRKTHEFVESLLDPEVKENPNG